MPSDAAFREAVTNYKVFVQDVERMHIEGEKDSPTMKVRLARRSAAEARVLALYAERDEALAYANELCRSAFQIASRQGRDTNWSGFANRLMEALAQQHRVMYPGVESLQGQAEPYRVPANAERQGEVYEVEPVVGEHYSRPGVLFQWYEHRPGDRVRVVRCEVGMYDPKNDPPTGGAK